MDTEVFIESVIYLVLPYAILLQYVSQNRIYIEIDEEDDVANP